MLYLVVAMLVILVLAGLVVLYVAFPHRGEDVPYVGWLGRLLRKGVDTAPTLDNTADTSADTRAGTSDAGPAHETSSLALDLTSLDHGRPEGRRRGE
jgi:hypothetical protein